MRKMKDSGIPWIGEIPVEWQVYPARYAFSEIRTKNTDGSVTNALKFYNGTIVPKTNFDADSDEYVADTITNYTVVNPDTIMINGLNLNYDLKSLRVGLVKETGVITSAYLALWPNSSRILPQYATYLFKGYETKMAFHNMGAGIRKTLGFKEFKRQPVLFPAIDEQQRIVTFLDTECARIDAVMEQTRASIEEYKKYREAIIDSAIVHCEANCIVHSKLRHLGQLKNGLNFNDKDSDQKIKILGVGDFQNHTVIDSPEMFSEVPLNEVANDYLLQNGDIVFVRSNGSKELVGRSVMIDKITYPVTFSGFCIRFRNNMPAIANNRYLLYFFRSAKFRELIKINSGGTNINNLSQDILNMIRIPLPSMELQKEFVKELDNRMTKLEGCIIQKKQLLSELESYKKSLIFEYVTGKKEVS